MGDYTTRLFATPSLLSGFARTLDIGGTFDRFNVSRDGREADATALRADMLAIFADLRAAVEAEQSK